MAATSRHPNYLVSGSVAKSKASAAVSNAKEVADKGVVWSDENLVDKEVTGMGYGTFRFIECKGTVRLAACTARASLVVSRRGSRLRRMVVPPAAINPAHPSAPTCLPRGDTSSLRLC